jgi:hypothetical protein
VVSQEWAVQSEVSDSVAAPQVGPLCAYVVFDLSNKVIIQIAGMVSKTCFDGWAGTERSVAFVLNDNFVSLTKNISGSIFCHGP